MVDMNTLTKRQQEIFEYVKSLRARARLPADRARHRQGDRADLVLDRARPSRQPLEKLGVLKRDPTKPRAIEVLVDKAKAVVTPNGLPLVGQVAAGQPVLADENIEEYVPVPRSRVATRASSCCA